MFILLPTDLGLWLQVAGPFGLLFDFVEMEAGRMELRRRLQSCSPRTGFIGGAKSHTTDQSRACSGDQVGNFSGAARFSYVDA